MIYLISDENNKVILQHHKPFHEVHGLKQSKEDLEQAGIFVDSLPLKPEPLEAKGLILYTNPVRWEYVDRTLTKIEKLDKLVIDGILTQEQANGLV